MPRKQIRHQTKTVTRPILFSGPMVKAILEDRKTQTRRVVEPQPIRQHHVAWVHGAWRSGFCVLTNYASIVKAIRCPYGVPGDRLWVRESYKPHCGQPNARGVPCGRYCADGEWFYGQRGDEHPGNYYLVRGRTVPSIHMPRWASRITLGITDVRVERLQNISFDDCVSEGIERMPGADAEFRRLWDSVNVDHGCGWKWNPWVWAVTFQAVD